MLVDVCVDEVSVVVFVVDEVLVEVEVSVPVVDVHVIVVCVLREVVVEVVT